MDNKIKHSKDCLHNFQNHTKIEAKYPKIKNWTIKHLDYETRIEKLKNSTLFNEMKITASDFARYKDPEVLSWIDSLYLINETFNNENLLNDIKENTQILQEYLIPYTNKNRADFILAKDNKLVIVEFTFKVKDFIEKASQCLVYKDIIKQQLKMGIECYSYIFSYTDEEETINDSSSKLQDQILDFINFLNQYLKEENAYEQLANITIKNNQNQKEKLFIESKQH